MSVTLPAPAPIPAELETLFSRMRFPYARKAAPEVLAIATVDRLMHHAHLIETSGESHRLAQAMSGRGVVPLI